MSKDKGVSRCEGKLSVVKSRPDVIIVNCKAPRLENWRQWFLLRSDAHHDNAHADWTLERKHLDQAREIGAGIIDNGDLHCAMQGKWDRRADLSQCRPEHQEGRYLDSLVNTAVDFYKPYADNFVCFAPGNHETAILRHHETHLTERTAKSIGEDQLTHSYAGWIRLSFTFAKTRRYSLDIYRHHGYGGGGPVTRGVIQTNRMAVYLSNADIVFTGHTHDEWCVPIQRVGLNARGNPFSRKQWHIRAAGYKDEFLAAEGDGYHHEKGRPPKPAGAYWLRVTATVAGLRVDPYPAGDTPPPWAM